MPQKVIIGIKRKTDYSPNHIGNDGMIFDMTVEELRKLGYETEEYTESEFLYKNVEGKYIFNMARSKNTMKRLQKLQDGGAIIINSGYGIANCIRDRVTKLLINNDVPHPNSIIIDTNDDPTEDLMKMNAGAFWVKRGDSHAMHSEDVAYARNIEEVRSMLKEFSLRNIPNAVINEHLVGDLVKFYGVAGTDFFYWFYPFDLNHSKFGHEAINGEGKGFSFDVDKFKAACNKASEILDVKIYGGDCIVAEDGSFKIIDFNDWPSFAPCRNEAVPYIAQCIHKNISDSNSN